MPSSYFRQEMFASQTGEALLCRMKIDPLDGSDLILVINNFDDVIIGGQTYTAFPFDITFPEEKDNTPFNAEISIGAVDQKFIQLVRSLSAQIRPTVELALIMSSYPDVDEHGPYTFELKKVDWDNKQIKGVMSFDNQDEEPYPGHKFTPSQYPTLFS